MPTEEQILVVSDLFSKGLLWISEGNEPAFVCGMSTYKMLQDVAGEHPVEDMINSVIGAGLEFMKKTE